MIWQALGLMPNLPAAKAYPRKWSVALILLWLRQSMQPDHLLHPFLSHLSFAFPSATVCHCIFSGLSAPPQANGLMWSITKPLQGPLAAPVAGHGCCCLNATLALWERLIRASAGVQTSIRDKRRRTNGIQRFCNWFPESAPA